LNISIIDQSLHNKLLSISLCLINDVFALNHAVQILGSSGMGLSTTYESALGLEDGVLDPSTLKACCKAFSALNDCVLGLPFSKTRAGSLQL